MSITKRGSVYRARIRDAVGKEHCRHFDTRRAAVAWESEQLTAKAKGQSLDLGDRTTVGEYARRWATGRPFRASTARNVEGLIKNHIEATPLGSRRLNAVRPSEVQTWATDRSKLMSPGRLKILVGYLRSIYRDAVLDRLVATSPVVRIAMPSIERERVIPLTVGEVMALADAMPDRNRAMVIVQATCGLRISELVALRLEDINFLKRTVRVEYQFETHTKRRVEPKTPRSRRTLPLPTFTAEVLAAHLAKYPPAVDGSLFSTYLGTPYRIDIYSTHFKAAVKKADLPAKTTPHACRHFFASVLIDQGESLVTVANLLGHANTLMVATTYGHIMPKQEDKTRRAIDSAFAADRDRIERTGE